MSPENAVRKSVFNAVHKNDNLINFIQNNYRKIRAILNDRVVSTNMVLEQIVYYLRIVCVKSNNR